MKATTLNERPRGPGWLGRGTRGAAVTALIVTGWVAQAATAMDRDLGTDDASAAMRSPWRAEQAGPVVGMFLAADEDPFEAMHCRGSVVLTDFALADGTTVDLDLEQFWVTEPDATFVIGTDKGDVPMDAPETATFRGTVAGVPGSWVFLGLTPDQVQGVIHVGDNEEYFIATPRDTGKQNQERRPMIYERFSASADGVFAPPVFHCEAEYAPDAIAIPETGGDDDGTITAYTWKVLDQAIDCDWEYRNLFSSVNETAAFAVLLTAASSSIYERDMQLKISLNYIRVWNTSSDPYTKFDTNTALPEFRDYWNANMGGVGRNFAHLLSAKDMGGGRAYIQGLCNSSSYGVSGNNSGSFPYPLQMNSDDNWDIIVFTHEQGHNIGSAHTHCFNPPIDMCYNQEGGCYNGSPVCQVGTIMSYCHTCPGGLSNMTLQFHSRCIDVMRTYVDGRGCPTTGRNPCYVDVSYNGTEKGTSSQPYNSVFEGFKYVIPGGTVRIKPGSYSDTFPVWYPLNRPMTFNTNGSGTVTIGN